MALDASSETSFGHSVSRCMARPSEGRYPGGERRGRGRTLPAQTRFGGGREKAWVAQCPFPSPTSPLHRRQCRRWLWPPAAPERLLAAMSSQSPPTHQIDPTAWRLTHVDHFPSFHFRALSAQPSSPQPCCHPLVADAGGISPPKNCVLRSREQGEEGGGCRFAGSFPALSDHSATTDLPTHPIHPHPISTTTWSLRVLSPPTQRESHQPIRPHHVRRPRRHGALPPRHLAFPPLPPPLHAQPRVYSYCMRCCFILLSFHRRVRARPRD